MDGKSNALARETFMAPTRIEADGGKRAAELAKALKVSLPTLYNTLKRAGWTPGGARAQPGRIARPPSRAVAKRGRAFKFSDEQAAGFRKRVEGGASTAALAKELKLSLPTMYSTLKRAGRKGRRARAA